MGLPAASCIGSSIWRSCTFVRVSVYTWLHGRPDRLPAFPHNYSLTNESIATTKQNHPDVDSRRRYGAPRPPRSAPLLHLQAQRERRLPASSSSTLSSSSLSSTAGAVQGGAKVGVYG